MRGLHFLSYAHPARPGRWPASAREVARMVAFSQIVRARLEARYERHFARSTKANLFRGVYATFDEAARAAPATKPVGYDYPGPAAMYRDRLDLLRLADYPVLFWLARILPGAARLFDLGGHVGLRYYGFRSRLPMPEGLTWQVMDVTAVADAGRELAREKAATALRFTDERDQLAGADVLLATGSLQYLEKPLHEILGPLSPLPPHVLVNLTPMHPERAYYTLQNIGPAFCPYRIESRSSLVAGMAALGYVAVDSWTLPEKLCPIPFHPAYSIRGYTGIYFARGERP